MKKLFFKLYSIFSFIYYNILNKIKNSNNILKLNGFFFGKMKITGENNYINLNGRISRARLIINGSNNFIQIKQGIISNINIQITGNNHKIIINKHRGIVATKIIIFGYNNNLTIGEMTGIGGARIVIGGNDNYIKIGKHNMISDNVEIWATDTHSILDNKTKLRINNDKPIVLKDHVWVGSGVCILKGVTINRNAILGMKSVIINDVPENSISVGIPNKTVKENVDWCIENL